MLDISRPLQDKISIEGKLYPLDLSFDNVLRLLEMMCDKSIAEEIKPHLAISMLIDRDVSLAMNSSETIELFKMIFDTYISFGDDDSVASVDLAGNPLPVKKTDGNKKIYSLKHDGEYIYSSFLFAYGIDLFEEQGKMHWHKFNALMNGLPDDCKFMRVIKIREWQPSKGDSSEYKKQMRELKEVYKLPDDADY